MEPSITPSVEPAGQAAPTAEAVASKRWLWATLRRYLPYYRSAMLAAFVSNVLMLFIAQYASVIYDRVIPHQAMVTLWSLSVGALLAIGLEFVARQLRSFLVDTAGKRADLELSKALFAKVQSLPLEHKPQASGTFAYQLAQLEQVREFGTSATMAAVSDLPFVLLFVGMIGLVGGPLVWVMAVTLPCLAAMMLGLQVVLKRSMRRHQAQLADQQGLVLEALEGMEALRAAGAEQHFQRRHDELHTLAAQNAVYARSVTSLAMNLTSTVQNLVTLVMLVWGVHLIQLGELTSGGLIASIMFGMRAVAPVATIMSLATRWQGVRAALMALDQLVQKPSIRPPGKTFLRKARVLGGLSLHQVAFQYQTQGDVHSQRVLHEVSIRIKPGERVAILGRIGSGKSSLLRLMAGLYQPTQGQVELDGFDLRQLEPQQVRDHLGFMAQEPFLFRGTLRDNILLGRQKVSAEQLQSAIDATGLKQLVQHHRLGLDLPVGENGNRLSGGQRQLVVLARCLAADPSVLLLDEPTSAMDAQTELMFLRHLHANLADKTLVVVTHRPAVLELVDRMIVLEDGRVIIDGPKAAVLAALSRPTSTGPAKAPPNAAPASTPMPAPVVVPANLSSAPEPRATDPTTSAAPPAPVLTPKEPGPQAPAARQAQAVEA